MRLVAFCFIIISGKAEIYIKNEWIMNYILKSMQFDRFTWSENVAPKIIRAIFITHI